MAQTAQQPHNVNGEWRGLPDSITIPRIFGEMVTLRPATLDDLPTMDDLNAYHGASGITGKDRKAEKSAVRAWVQRSIAWQEGRSSEREGIRDPEERGTIAWTITRREDDANPDCAGIMLGMIFLIDIDGWSRSARIQVILGEEYRGRGYSRDAMPRVMAYGFADTPEGLGLHRIWVSVPAKNTRSISVYQSLGFMLSGTSRDALWDNSLGKYQDLMVMDTLVDEYDPISSLEAFGMHWIEGNPGIQKALDSHRRAVEQRKHAHCAAKDAVDSASSAQSSTMNPDVSNTAPADVAQSHKLTVQPDITPEIPADATPDATNSENRWPYNAAGHNASKKAWWRTLGARRSESRKRSMNDDK